MANAKPIKFTLYTVRPANEKDVEESVTYCNEHAHLYKPGGLEAVKIGEEFDAEDEKELPARWDICNRCKGEGTHTNPNIDGHGISMEEWFGPDWDEDSREMYMSGGYDVACEANCNDGKVRVVDEAQCQQEPLKSLLAAYEEQAEERAQNDYEDRRMRYAESGGMEGSRY